ncbi:hypothetical protein [Amnibacterium kyonggiense]|uniref:Uncharacterized protein n=1 Tax=Amnibacterium kyonggiense TaxID=595671 RepID=A0A4R7FPF1_9MICO|nr:hypothetical protein [Amnibacterium kyonggiense]TDS79612.1 hypothetical protein CLV52_0146 [Amnibacterium kyonggiense]
MRKTVFLLAVLGGTAYVLGERARRPSDSHYTAYQRAALLWTDPRVVKARRALRRRAKRVSDRTR